MPNSPNPFLLLTAEHLIYWFLMKFIIIFKENLFNEIMKLNKEKNRKNEVVSNTM